MVTSSWSSTWAILSGLLDQHGTVFSPTAPLLVLCQLPFAWITGAWFIPSESDFIPLRGAGFFGRSAADLAERLLPLSEVCRKLDDALAERLVEHPNTETEGFRHALDRVLLDQLRHALPPDTEVITAVDRLTRSDVMPVVTEIARELHLSSRQLQRRFLTAVGMTPKRFMRVMRFARAWQSASMSPHLTWAGLAAEHGFADQAHLVREFRAFGAEPPTHLFTPEWYGATEISRESGPAQGVRSVQDARRRPKR